MQALSDRDMLNLWDRGAAGRPLDRALLTLGTALPDTPPARLADWPLGRRNKALIDLRCACFGPRIEGWLACTRCGEKLEFGLDGRALANAGTPWDDDVEPKIEIGAHAFALPTSRHLARVAHEADARAAGAKLLQSCCLDPNPPAAWAEDEIEEIGDEMARADPLAETRLSFKCPQCGVEWDEDFDIAAFLWTEIESAAKALLAAVHALASVYGWSEFEHIVAQRAPTRILPLDGASMTGFLQRLAQGARKETGNIRPMRGSVFAPRAPIASEGFEFDQETLATPAERPHGFDAEAEQPLRPAAARDGPPPAREAPPARERFASLMDTSPASAASKPVATPQRETSRAEATTIRAPVERPNGEDRSETFATESLVNDSRARRFRPEISAIDSTPRGAEAPDGDAAFRAAPKPYGPPIEASFAPPPTPRRAPAFAPPTPSAAQPPDEVHIHIGRIEVTALQPPRPAARPPHNATLMEEYVKRRDGRTR